MREIKFKMYHKKSKKMYDVGKLDFENGWAYIRNSRLYSLGFFDLNEVELMQFTGAYDQNGKEIYEGYIVRFDYYEGLTGKIEEHIIEIQDFWELVGFAEYNITDLEVIRKYI